MSYGVPYASVIPDHRFTASSSKPNSLPKDARLRASKEWIPNTNSGGWLQIDLGSVVYVCGVATQGRESAYTKTYKLGMSLNNVDYTIYQDKVQYIYHCVSIGVNPLFNSKPYDRQTYTVSGQKEIGIKRIYCLS